MLGWLARREHSRKEVETKLKRKGCDAKLAEEVAAVLAAQHLLSDERFAEVLVRSRRNRGYGPVRIRKELEQRGLAVEAIEQWLDIHNDEWLAELKQLWRKKFGGRVPRDYAERAKQARFLQYRGFTFDQIQRVLGDLDT
ncbi:MAG: regulatory protein RecX [Gammaproteobacteria bacterium]|nr:regulatory protein RecX [Gammaproteobacteria bacterium]